MFGLKLPVVAAAGAVAVLAVGGVSGLPKQAVADEGGGGPGSSTSSSSGDPAGTSGSSPAGGSGMDVSPRTVEPGGVVSLHLSTSCKAGKSAKASADVFVDTVTLAPSDDGHGMEGDAFIKSDAVEGSYSIAVECDGGAGSASASVTVSADASGGGHDAGPDSPSRPVNPVPAGGGGAAQRLAARSGGAEQLAAGPAAAGGSAGPLLATGGAAAAGLAGVALYRRRGTARG